MRAVSPAMPFFTGRLLPGLFGTAYRRSWHACLTVQDGFPSPLEAVEFLYIANSIASFFTPLLRSSLIRSAPAKYCSHLVPLGRKTSRCHPRSPKARTGSFPAASLAVSTESESRKNQLDGAVPASAFGAKINSLAGHAHAAHDFGRMVVETICSVPPATGICQISGFSYRFSRINSVFPSAVPTRKSALLSSPAPLPARRAHFPQLIFSRTVRAEVNPLSVARPVWH